MAYDKLKYERLKARAESGGHCVCGRDSAQGRKLCEACLSYQREAYKKRRDLRKELHLCQRCGEKVEGESRSVNFCVKCLEWKKDYSKYEFKEAKKEVMFQYGNSCQCCGEENLDFLAIDHIEGGGTKHREEVGGGSNFYLLLKKQGFPKGYRVLCHNCNFSVHLNKGTCAHTLEENNIIEGEPIWPYDPIKQVFAGIFEYS